MNKKDAILAMLNGRKVRAAHWDSDYFIQFINGQFKAKGTSVFDINGMGGTLEIYEPKIKKYQWIYRNRFVSDKLMLTTAFHETSEDAEADLVDIDSVLIQRADWTEIEVSDG